MWIPLAVAGVSALAGWLSQRKQSKENKRLAEFQADANERYQAQQNAYNTPQSQMSRFQQAGLNPNLIYGQGNPGNQSAPLSYPDIKTTDYQNLAGSVPLINQTAMTMSQTSALDAKTRQTAVLTQLNKLQAELLKKNPLMDDEGFKATIQSLVSSAQIKATESKMKDSQLFVQEASAGHQVNKVFQEVKLLDAKYNLSQADGKIKAEVVRSKQFQNDMLEIQKKFLSDGEISPGMFLQFIQMLILKLM